MCHFIVMVITIGILITMFSPGRPRLGLSIFVFQSARSSLKLQSVMSKAGRCVVKGNMPWKSMMSLLLRC